MKYIKQFLIIVLVSFIGEFCNYFFALPIPGNIYGMVLMFLLLMSGFIKINQVEETAGFLIDIMPILFIPSAVGIITQLDTLKAILPQITIITVVTTICVMAVTGLVTQSIIKKNKG